MDRAILHADLNNFYASVECMRNPELRDFPLAVCGDPALRHGIVLAKNYHAKAYGVKTGEAIWEARSHCPDLVLVPADFEAYLKYSRLVRDIYSDYTDQIEPFGIDEAWLDVTGSTRLFGSGEQIAGIIKERVKNELGLTLSVGVSFNKIFAKLGSDYKKPDAVTVISRENFREICWCLSATDLLFVGRATAKKLRAHGIFTIGGIAQSSAECLRSFLGKWGEILWSFANGLDKTSVAKAGSVTPVKSIGNSTTTPRDLRSEGEVAVVAAMLAESVAQRLRRCECRCSTVSLSLRGADLISFTRQCSLAIPTDVASDITAAALSLYRANWSEGTPLRSIGVRAEKLSAKPEYEQLSLFAEESAAQRAGSIEHTVDAVREKYGHFAIGRALALTDKQLSGLNPITDHTIHPVAYIVQK